MNTLPQGLIDLIVDGLQDDHAALKSISLTSRVFYPRTRPHLFRRVELFEDEQAQRFAALCHDSGYRAFGCVPRHRILLFQRRGLGDTISVFALFKANNGVLGR